MTTAIETPKTEVEETKKNGRRGRRGPRKPITENDLPKLAEMSPEAQKQYTELLGKIKATTEAFQGANLISVADLKITRRVMSQKMASIFEGLKPDPKAKKAERLRKAIEAKQKELQALMDA